MPRVVDCLSDEAVFRDDSIAICEKECESIGGNKKCYYVFTEIERHDIVKEVKSPKGELTLF